MFIKTVFTCLSLFASALFSNAAEETTYGEHKIVRYDSGNISNCPFSIEDITEFYCQNLKAAYGENELKEVESTIKISFESHHKCCKEENQYFLFLLMKGEVLKGLSWVTFHSNIVEIGHPRVVHSERNLYDIFSTEIFKNSSIQYFHIEIPKTKAAEIGQLKRIGAQQTGLFKSTSASAINDRLAFKLDRRLGGLFFKNLK